MYAYNNDMFADRTPIHKAKTHLLSKLSKINTVPTLKKEKIIIKILLSFLYRLYSLLLKGLFSLSIGAEKKVIMGNSAARVKRI